MLQLEEEKKKLVPLSQNQKEEKEVKDSLMAKVSLLLKKGSRNS